ncbi:MAG: TolC family protein [Saprospiraceae bacterium]|jgi:outer membrane protein TolC|nr:TolC family protein [Saprospiraceae bacterium]MBK7795677.1 TolC family protein [Saprospiraceae bacterium]MBL0260789.1 TolC family protein [Saprospiraceae bacterium]
MSNNFSIIKLSIFWACILVSSQLYSQKRYTIGQLYEWAIENAAITRGMALTEQNSDLQTRIASVANYPQISINGQSTYQSDVTSLPIKIPNINVQETSKDQYKLVLDVQQLIYNGGIVTLQKKIVRSNADSEKQQTLVEQAKLRDRILQVYAILLSYTPQKKVLELTKDDLDRVLSKVKAQFENGISFQSHVWNLEAEIKKWEQRMIELESQRSSSIKALELYTGRDLDDNALFAEEEFQVNMGDFKNLRPEWQLFQIQRSSLDLKSKSITAKRKPFVGLFAQGAYGRPGLNFLNNEFQFYYIAGVKAQWNLTPFYTTKKEKSIVELQKSMVQIQEDQYKMANDVQITGLREDLKKLDDILVKDQELIDLRTKIKRATEAQLEQGVITSADFIRELNAEENARQMKGLHETQKEIISIQLKNALGIYEK